MKKNLIAALLAALLLCSCAAGEQPELQPVPEESSAVEQPIQREEETESAQTKSAPAMPVNEENSFPEEITDYLLTQYGPTNSRGARRRNSWWNGCGCWQTISTLQMRPFTATGSRKVTCKAHPKTASSTSMT